MLTNPLRSVPVRRLLAISVMLPVLVGAAVSPTWAGSPAGNSFFNQQKTKKHKNLPESGVLSSLGIALAVMVSAAVYRRRRRDLAATRSAV